MDWNIDESAFFEQSSIKSPKARKYKFIKEINLKLNSSAKKEKDEMIASRKRKVAQVFKDQHSRSKNQVPIDEFSKYIIPGAKILKGQLIEDKLHGYFEIQYDNGNTFFGNYQNGYRVEGRMHYFRAKCTYQGSFFSEKFYGVGKLLYKDGRSIEGEWENSILIGNAIIQYPNKDVYYGQVNTKLYKHGYGHLFLRNGQKYIGQFQNGSISGEGSYYRNEQLIARGIWEKGSLIRSEEGQYIIQTNVPQGSNDEFLNLIFRKAEESKANEVSQNIYQYLVGQLKLKASRSFCSVSQTQLFDYKKEEL